MKQQTLTIETTGRGVFDVTQAVQRVVERSRVHTGLCHVFLQHTSASLMLSENADPQVQRDLESFMARLVPDGDAIFDHVAEGPDDMPAHVRSVLTGNDLQLPVTAGRCAFGTWQGVFLWEHRTRPHRRTLVVTVYGTSQRQGR